MTKDTNSADYFNNPVSPKHKQYEMVRAITTEKIHVENAAKRFGYETSTAYSLLRDFRAGKIEFFPIIPKGPKQKRTQDNVRKKIITLRKQRLAVHDIQNILCKEDIETSKSTIERVLKEEGYGKLKRRTNKEIGKTVKNKIIPARSGNIDFSELEPFEIDSPSVGVFFFLPYILESGVLDIVEKCKLPDSKDIGATQACLSMLILKLIGCKRLTHIDKYDQEPGLGIFAGLNLLPKPTYMNTYSCRCSEEQLMELQNKIVAEFKNQYPHFYNNGFINIDFHSIPHFGDESEMEQIWHGSRGKTMKGSNTVFASDSKSNAVVYTRADILRKEESKEIMKFVDYWKSINKDVNETLVFDCKLTTYNVLDELNTDNIRFITLRKRSKNLIRETLELPENVWKKVYVDIPKRKHKNISVYESEILLSGCENTFRQVAVKDHGRDKPTFILTNNRDLSLVDILEVYAKRWHIENKIAELVAFFNLNALSSPVMIRIHFDILWTVIADTLYHVFANDLRRFEDNLAQTIFRKFIDMPGKVIYEKGKFLIKIRKRAHTPILKGLKKLQTPFSVPWLDGKTIEIIWTA